MRTFKRYIKNINFFFWSIIVNKKTVNILRRYDKNFVNFDICQYSFNINLPLKQLNSCKLQQESNRLPVTEKKKNKKLTMSDLRFE